MSDIRLSLRFLLKKRGWTAAAVLTVAIGIAGSTLAFSLVDRALWRPLGFDDGGELVTLYARSGGEYATIPWRDYVAFRDALLDGGDGPAELAAFVRTFSTVGGGEFPELHEGELVSGNFFSVLRVQPFLGRSITPFDNVTPGAHPVIVLSHFLWRTQFGADADVLGRDVLLDGRAYEVVGVAPPGFRGPVWPSFESAFWIPAMMAADEFGADEHRVFESGGLPVFQTVGRMRGGRRMEALQARIDPLDAVLARGLLLGLVLSAAATGGLASLLYETDPRDPLTLAGAAVVLGLAAMLAAFAPARRAARVDPVTVLRAE